MKLQNKVALVTGASRGIGRAIALQLAQEGAHVVVHYRSAEAEAKEVVQAIKAMGGEALAVSGDISRSEDVEAVVAKTIEVFGTVDILVNNAGILQPSPLEETTDEIWHQIIETNLSGAFYGVRAVIPHMKKQKSGKIINLSSIVAFVGSRSSGHYAISKAGIQGLTKTYVKALGPYNIQINGVAPGAILTDMLQGYYTKEQLNGIAQETPLKRLGIPQDIAHAVLFLASPDADFITGQTLIVDGGRIS